MASTDHTTQFERMDAEECLRLLEAEDVGRLAIVQGRVPVIFPVNYVLDGDSIVFRTAPGTKLTHGDGTLVAFEIDHLSRAERTGWSVVVTGRLDEITPTDAAEQDRLDRLPLTPWAGGTRDHWMRLDLGIVTGRRIGRRSESTASS
jgi:nitroimidazol reductase NimA-like FMN-containing flavoprotein (pyridoxamine 5'-phosphate oxidase superfamily)